MKNSHDYKQTEIGRIPKEWEVVRLGEIVSNFENGIWGEKPDIEGESYPVIRSTEITHDGKIELSTVAYRKIPQSKIDKYNLQNGDILIVGSSGSPRLIGRTALFEKKDNKIYLFSNFIVRIRPDKMNSKFLFYFLNSSKYHKFLLTFQQTSTGLRNFPKKEFIKMRLPLPPLPEQKKIAEILSTVDEAIEKVDMAIEKTEKLKKGLMQELLSKGWRRKNEGGREYKETEIGRIPKEWKVARIEDIGNVVTGTTPSTKVKEYWGKGLPFVTPTDFSNSKYVDRTERSVTQRGVEKARIIPKDSVMVTCIASVGEVSMASEKCITNQQINTIICRESINPHYIYYIMVFRKKVLKKWAGVTTSPIIKKSLFEKFQLPLPPLPEQKKIAEILSTVDKKLEMLHNRKNRYEKVKKGLMNDLLTGKKRVKVNKALNSKSKILNKSK